MVVLSVIGHILLILLFIVIALVVCLVVLPVVYRARVVKPEDGDLAANGCVRWLFGFILFTFAYGKDGFDWHVRVIGIPVSDLIRKKKKADEAKVVKGPARAKKQPTIKPGQRSETLKEKETEPEADYTDAQHRKYFSDESVFAEQEEEGSSRKSGVSPKGIFRKIRLTLKSICDKLVLVGKGIRLLNTVWPYAIRLLRHIRPRKISGEVLFGLDDPSVTGKLLGLIGIVYPVLPEELEIIPDFTEKRFACDLKAGGHLFIVYVVVNVIKILRLPQVKDFIKTIRKNRRLKNG